MAKTVPENDEYMFKMFVYNYTTEDDGSLTADVQIDVDFYKDDLRLIWFLNDDLIRYPITNEDQEFQVSTEKYSDGHIQSTLRYPLPQQSHKRQRIVEIVIESLDHSFCATYSLAAIEPEITPTAISMFSLPYVTKRPAALIRFSEQQPALIETEVTFPAGIRFFVNAYFLITSPASSSRLPFFSTDATAKTKAVPGVKMQQHVTNNDDGVISYSIIATAQITGLLLVEFNGNGYFEFNVQVLNNDQESWLDRQPLSVAFTGAHVVDEDMNKVMAADEGRPFMIQATALAPGMVDAVRLTRDGMIVPELAVFVEYQDALNLVYRAAGDEEGEYTFSAIKDGVIVSVTKTLIRLVPLQVKPLVDIFCENKLKMQCIVDGPEVQSVTLIQTRRSGTLDANGNRPLVKTVMNPMAVIHNGDHIIAKFEIDENIDIQTSSWQCTANNLYKTYNAYVYRDESHKTC